MKAKYIGTSALVAASSLIGGCLAGGNAASAEGIELGLGGFMYTLFSVGGIDEASSTTADYNATGLFSDGEVYIKGNYKADNGITFGVQVELEASSVTDDIDERYIIVEGDFGRIVAGSENSAAYIMHYAAPYAGIPINSGWVTVFIPAPSGFQNVKRSPTGSTYIDIGDDENLLTYYTPRFSGFQFGVSYIPAVANTGDGQNFPVQADTNAKYSNGVSVGVNYVQDFDGFGVAISGGYRFAQKPDNTLYDDYNDYQAATVGLNVSYAGFTFGGSYANVMDGADFSGNGSSSNEGQGWDIGLTYGLGPWLFGVTYLQGKSDASNLYPAEDEMTAIVGGVNYKLGPGISARGAILWGQYDEENASEDQSGLVGIAGLIFNF